jgi:hypothetical protein
MSAHPAIGNPKITREDLISSLVDIVKEFDQKRLIISPDLVEPDVEDAMQPVRKARTLLFLLGRWEPPK